MVVEAAKRGASATYHTVRAMITTLLVLNVAYTAGYVDPSDMGWQEAAAIGVAVVFIRGVET